MRYTGLVDHYRSRLPFAPNVRAIALCEGRTPLIKLENLPKRLGFENDLYVKFEGLNPTGSFKDRGMTAAVTQAVHEGSRAIICASTGNTSAAAAAYAVRAGITAFVLIPEGKIALGKLAQAVVHGAVVIQVMGNFDDGMRLVKEVAQTSPVSIVNSINPFRLQGQKTAAFEIVEALGRAPDYHCLPVGNAGNITAHWIGYSEASGHDTAAHTLPAALRTYDQTAIASNRPIMVGYQAAGAAPFLRGGPVKDPETVATAIRIGDPQSWSQAWHVQKESGGWFDECTDAEILATQKLLAESEGVFCEPASAASLCGALRDIKAGKIKPGKTVVCTLTGNGLKDPDVVMKNGLTGLVQVPAERAAVEKAILNRL
ncbi:L-threonine synthase [Panacagrimonas perspica]|uniref:Threonine synthase n=1 Tax=Panacagrimonas perspica TaxID=381431 RepID=A0A4R7PAP4_9GAMM|nr:threonine synthase [Panacagrimonas perspica]TDU31114.1 L-threonine synthase [Panacagrimonas perspica]THD01751.1 threonine synthase [Panacagrimonas perspica]